MRQLQGLPAALADNLVRVELAKARIPAFQKLGQTPLSVFGLLPLGPYVRECAIFSRGADLWRLSFYQTDQHWKPALLELGVTVCARSHSQYDVLISSEEQLRDVVAVLLVYYGVSHHQVDAAATLDDPAKQLLGQHGLEDALAVPAPSCKMELAQLEIRSLLACAATIGTRCQGFASNFEAIAVAENALRAAADLDTAEKEALRAQAHSLRIRLEESCRKEVICCEDDARYCLPGFLKDPLDTLARWEWWLTQRIGAMPHAWRQRKQSVQRDCERVGTELFAEYRDFFKLKLQQLQECKEKTVGCTNAENDAAARRIICRQLALTAGRLAQLCDRLRLRHASRDWQERSTSFRLGLDCADSQLVALKLQEPYGID